MKNFISFLFQKGKDKIENIPYSLEIFKKNNLSSFLIFLFDIEKRKSLDMNYYISPNKKNYIKIKYIFEIGKDQILNIYRLVIDTVKTGKISFFKYLANKIKNQKKYENDFYYIIRGALEEAAEKNKLEIAKYIISLNILDFRNINSSLMIAARFSSKKVFWFVFSYQKNIDLQKMLISSIEGGNLDIVKFVISIIIAKNGEDGGDSEDEIDWNNLFLTNIFREKERQGLAKAKTEEETIKIADYLITQGATPNFNNSESLIVAFEEGNFTMIKYLEKFQPFLWKEKLWQEIIKENLLNIIRFDELDLLKYIISKGIEINKKVVNHLLSSLSSKNSTLSTVKFLKEFLKEFLKNT